VSILDLDVTLRRGLNYYTGQFEVAPKEVAMGSIGGGGRYDDLTGIFGLKHEWCWNFFGLDRIYLVVEELNLFGNGHRSSKAVYYYGDTEAFYAYRQ
jgi:histidyl-tRNA synthetase